MKPKGLVAAASITSQTLMSMPSHISAISFTRPMLIMRKVFSSSFTISATRVLLTGTTFCSACEKKTLPISVQAGVMPPTTLGVFEVWYTGLPGSTRSGEKHRKKSSPTFRPSLFKRRQQQFVRRARVGGRFQNHQQAGMKVLGDLVGGRHDVAHVGVFGLAQRRGHANIDGVEIADHGKVGGGIEAAVFHQLRDVAAGDILNIRLALHQAVNPRLLQVDAGDVESRLGKLHREGQPDITESHDAHMRGFGLDLFFECLKRAHSFFRNLH